MEWERPSDYWLLVRGFVPDVPDTILVDAERLQERLPHLDVERVARDAAEMIWDRNVGRQVAYTPEDVIARKLDDWWDRLTVGRYAVKLAQQDVRYYGVTDPDTEGYCSGCRRARPIESFSHRRLWCDDCVEEGA